MISEHNNYSAISLVLLYLLIYFIYISLYILYIYIYIYIYSEHLNIEAFFIATKRITLVALVDFMTYSFT